MPYEQIVKGYEIGPDRYVMITPEELESVEPQKTRTIDIEDFVELEQIDPIFYDHPYYLAPDKGAAKAYKLLLDAMEEADKVAIARVVIRSKESLVAIRAKRQRADDGDDAVRRRGRCPPARSRSWRPWTARRPRKRELDMAQQLIESLSSEFEPEKYRDEYRDRVLEMIEKKAAGREDHDRGAGRGAREGARPDGGARGLDRRGQEPGGQERRRPRRPPRRAAKNGSGSKSGSPLAQEDHRQEVGGRRQRVEVGVEGRRLSLSNLTKVMYPEPGLHQG